MECGYLKNKDLDAYDVAEVVWACAIKYVNDVLPAGGSILYIGVGIPNYYLGKLGNSIVYKISDFPGNLSKTDEALEFQVLAGMHDTVDQPKCFDLVFSTGEIAKLPQQSNLYTRVGSLLDGLTKPNGWNLHYFTGVVHEQWVWVHPIFNFLKERNLRDKHWAKIDDMASDDDAFYMSKATYDRCWKASSHKEYEAFGKVGWMNLAWKKK